MCEEAADLSVSAVSSEEAVGCNERVTVVELTVAASRCRCRCRVSRVACTSAEWRDMRLWAVACSPPV